MNRIWWNETILHIIVILCFMCFLRSATSYAIISQNYKNVIVLCLFNNIMAPKISSIVPLSEERVKIQFIFSKYSRHLWRHKKDFSLFFNFTTMHISMQLIQIYWCINFSSFSLFSYFLSCIPNRKEYCM